jgi:hypothetical protein
MGNIHPIDIASFIELFHRIDFNVADRAFVIMKAGYFWHRGFLNWVTIRGCQMTL